MTLFTDGFAGTAGTALDGRTGWTKFGSGANDNPVLNGSGGLKTAGADTTDSAIRGQDVGDADHFVQFIPSANAVLSNAFDQTTGCIAIVRATDRNAHIGAIYDDANGLWKIIAVGTFGSLASGAGDAPDGVTPLRFVAEGDDYSVYFGDMDTPVVTTTLSNAAYDTATACGIRTSTTSAEDPFIIGPYYSGLIADIGDIPGGGSGDSLVGGIFQSNIFRSPVFGRG
jgi:hypothetical protein